MNKNKLQPREDRIVVRPEKPATQSKGGILLPESKQDSGSSIGEVISVGPGKRGDDGKLINHGLGIGLTILYEKYAGTDIEVDGEKLVVIKASDVLAVVTQGGK